MTSTPEKTASNRDSLQRGKACLRCRKRKMRCDGSKPACQQCLRAKKGDACEYDDGKGKTRTQILRERVELLERRIRELEDPEHVPPYVALYDPHGRQMSEDSSSSYGSPASTSLTQSPYQPESRRSSWISLTGTRPTSPFPEVLYEDPLNQSQPTVDMAQMLLDIFAPHKHQSGLEIDILRLRESLSGPASEQRHPVLMNSIYLWACFVSRPEPLCQHEEYYLSQALESLRDALKTGDRILDIVQASCLLATYFFANGRVLEGTYHVSAAASLAIQHQLHEGINFEQNSGLFSVHQTLSYTNHPWERIWTFWQVYNIDRCWSVVMQKPPIIPDSPDAWDSVHCPWPQDPSHYESAQVDQEVSFQTVRNFFNGDMSPSGFSPMALRAKASALFQKAYQLSRSWDPRTKSSDVFTEEMTMLDLSINNFTQSLIPLHQLHAALPETKHMLIAAYSLAYCATIHLYRRFSNDDQVSYDKCLQAARDMLNVINSVGELEYDFLDPIVGHCWSIASEPLAFEFNRLGSSWALMNNMDVRNEIQTILYALNVLCAKFPVLTLPASKLRVLLGES